MTNQEAIEAIKLARLQVEWDYPMDYAAAFDKAIEALEQEPTLLSSGLEKNSKKLEKDFGELDCISRADAIKAMQDKAKKLTNEDTINGLCGAVAILFDLPSVTQQEPRKGQWYRQTNDYVDYYECSKCGMAMSLYDIKHYCPNCGSRNEVEK